MLCRTPDQRPPATPPVFSSDVKGSSEDGKFLQEGNYYSTRMTECTSWEPSVMTEMSICTASSKVKG